MAAERRLAAAAVGRAAARAPPGLKDVPSQHRLQSIDTYPPSSPQGGCRYGTHPLGIHPISLLQSRYILYVTACRDRHRHGNKHFYPRPHPRPSFLHSPLVLSSSHPRPPVLPNQLILERKKKLAPLCHRPPSPLPPVISLRLPTRTSFFVLVLSFASGRNYVRSRRRKKEAMNRSPTTCLCPSRYLSPLFSPLLFTLSSPLFSPLPSVVIRSELREDWPFKLSRRPVEYLGRHLRNAVYQRAQGREQQTE